jgi:hypothetical protein
MRQAAKTKQMGKNSYMGAASTLNSCYLEGWNAPSCEDKAVEEADGNEEFLTVRECNPPLPQLLSGLRHHLQDNS